MADLQVVHSAIPGRTRFRMDAVRRSPARARVLERFTAGLPGVLCAAVSPVTGSLLVQYDPHLSSTPTLVQALGEAFGSGAWATGGRGATAALRDRAGEAAEATVGPGPAGMVAASSRGGRRAPATASRVPVIAPAESPPWHLWTADAVARRLATNTESGLIAREAAQRIRRFGRNELPDLPRRPRSAILAEQVASVPALLLSTAAAFSFLTGAVVDAIFISGAVVANAVIGYFTEDYAERSIQSLRQTRAPHARVFRDGRRTKIAIEDVVPGDILLLEQGHVVPADGRIIRSENLVLDESLLTGESAGQPKQVEPSPQPDTPLAERSSMVYAGSAVASGKGAAIVTATGLTTELGRIRTLIGAAPDTPPPMSRELQRLGGMLALLSTAVCAVFAGAGFLLGLPSLEVLTITASLAVSAIPEGLPTVATTTLALGMRRMRLHNVVIRRLPAVAALGSATVLCVDKTGTLTENRMSIRCFVLADEETELVGTPPGGPLQALRRGQSVAPEDDPLLLSALQVGALCTEAELQRLPDGRWDAVGSSTEEALLLTAVAAGIDVQRLRAERALGDLKTRAPGRNYMVSVHSALDGRQEVFAKGAPEEVLALCAAERTRDGLVPLRSRRERALLAWNERLAARGMRVLGLARGVLAPGEEWDEARRALEWLGLVAMEDPVRGEAREAIEQLGGAGIRTLMLTGDQRTTAEAVARQIGLANGDPVDVAEAAEIEEYLRTGRPLPDVLARVSPEDKYQIVRLLQERGHVVMMTGDGINDAPALKASDVGITMGARSTQVARDLADVILLDDNLANLPIAVSQGRTIFANIRKALRFFLSSNLSDIVLVGACLALRLPFPLTALHLLWLNLVTDVFPALALAMEPGEPRVMRQPPRPPGEPLLTRPLWRIIGREMWVIAGSTFGAYLWGLGRYGPGAHARTLAFSTITMSQIAYASACRTEGRGNGSATGWSNPYLGACLALSAAAQAGTVLFPPLRQLLGLSALSLADWLLVAGASGSAMAATHAMKQLRPLRSEAFRPSVRGVPRPALAAAALPAGVRAR